MGVKVGVANNFLGQWAWQIFFGSIANFFWTNRRGKFIFGSIDVANFFFGSIGY